MPSRLTLALILLGCTSNAAAQYVVATPQTAQQYAAPAPSYAYAPAQYAAPMVAGPSCFGTLLGHVGRKLESYSWPRVQPMAMSVPMQTQQVMYVVMQPMAQSQPQLQVQYAPVGVPQQQSKNPPVQAPPMQAPPAYSSPQRSSEAAPPLPTLPR